MSSVFVNYISNLLLEWYSDDLSIIKSLRYFFS